MEFAIVTFPAAPVRKKPAQNKEMVSQLLFGESVKILKTKKNGWVRIRSLHDGYEGWLTTLYFNPLIKILRILKTLLSQQKC